MTSSTRTFDNSRLFSGLAYITVVAAIAMSGCTPPEAPVPEPISPDDFVATNSDFECLNNWDIVDNRAIVNRQGKTAEAINVALNRDSFVEFPVGTIIQALPTEAMVKRAAGYAPENNDWEYLKLSVSESGTVITERGVNLRNGGGFCQGCHEDAAEFDFICTDDGTCVDLGNTAGIIKDLRDSDPRCL